MKIQNMYICGERQARRGNIDRSDYRSLPPFALPRPSLVPTPSLNAESMACECAICLFEYQDPVSLPCGAWTQGR